MSCSIKSIQKSIESTKWLVSKPVYLAPEQRTRETAQATAPPRATRATLCCPRSQAGFHELILLSARRPGTPNVILIAAMLVFF
jgi:hypothetical protein